MIKKLSASVLFCTVLFWHPYATAAPPLFCTANPIIGAICSVVLIFLLDDEDGEKPCSENHTKCTKECTKMADQNQIPCMKICENVYYACGFPPFWSAIKESFHF